MAVERRTVQVICGLIWCIVAAGPVFGFAALKPVLIAQGVYREKCEERIDDNSYKLCSPQDLSLNFLFTLAAVVTNAASLVVGAILDQYGPRVTGIIGSFLLLAASFILSNGYWLVRYFDAYLIGYSVLALGGPFVFISCFQLANAFPNNSGLVLALLTGAFDSSSALFLLYRLAFFSSLGQRMNLSLKNFFSFYMVVPVFIFLCEVFVMPKESYRTEVAKLQEQALGESPLEDEEALIDAPISETASIDNYLPIPVPNRQQSDSVSLLNSINENLSRSFNSTNQNILTDQFAHQRSNSFNQRLLSSRRSSLVSNNIALNSDNRLASDVDIETVNPTVNSKVQDIHNTINNAITTSLRKVDSNTGSIHAAAGKTLANNIVSDSISIIEQTKTDNELAIQAGINGALHGATIKQQLCSVWFVLMALFTSIQMLRINYFVATIRSQEEYLLGDPYKAKSINEFFDIALPVGGLLSIPFIGVLLDNFKTITVLSVLLGVSLVIGIMGLIPNSLANYIGIMLMVVYRPFYYTAVSDYCAKVFGFASFGTIYGSIICISGLFNFVQTALDDLTHFTFGMNPIPINSLLTSLTAIIGGSLIIFVYHEEKKKPKDSLLSNTDIVNYGSTN